MVHFEVDVGLLEGAASNLRDAVSVGRDISEKKSSLTEVDAGSDKVGSAVADFVDEWGYGMELITDDAEKLAEMLEAGAKGYRDSEQAIVEALE